MNTRLGIVAPYPELLKLCEEASIEMEENADIRLGDLTAGVAIARDMERSGIDVIISRGGTALAIQKEIDLPVVPIQVSPIDVMRALTEAQNYDQRIGAVGFKNVVHYIDAIADILGITMLSIEVRSESDVEPAIERAVELGIHVVIGDVISTKITTTLGIQGILIRSGKEAIQTAINEAKHVAAVRRRERERAEEIKAILDFAHEGIIGTRPDGTIRICNPAAARILGISIQEVINRNIADIIPDISIGRLKSSEIIEVEKLSKIGSTAIVSSRVPIYIKGELTGAVITFQDVTRIQKLEEKARKELHAKGYVAQHNFCDILTSTESMKELISRARKYAKVDFTVLIYGETGTGKELFAQSIHNGSSRKGFPFVAINCAAIPENLLESELFGYEEGAFTGARRGGKRGLFEQAHKGTIFLDEIGEMSTSLQSRLLRVLEEHEIMRVGGDRIIPIDVRIIAATHVNLKEAIALGQFRKDLYYRLNKLALNILPLRLRPADIQVFCKYFLEQCSKHFNRRIQSFSSEAMDILKSYDWPGNVRELRSVIERLVVCVQSSTIDAHHIQSLMHEELSWSNLNTGIQPAQTPPESLDNLEQYAIRRALAESGGNKKKAAESLGICRTTLWRKLKKMERK